MYTLHIKKWFDFRHLPGGHKMALWIERVVGDERFWPIVIAIAMLAVLTAITIWAGASVDSNAEKLPTRFFPYNF